MIDRDANNPGGQVKVTFTLSGANPGETLSVAGDFNDWTPGHMPLDKQGSKRTTTVMLDAGRR